MQVDGMLEASTDQELQRLRDQAKADLENSLPEEVDGEIFSSYECRSLRGLGNPHPGDISEPGLLAAVDLPPPTYGPETFQGDIIDNTRLSRLQLEGVLYAAQRHTHMLPDGNRAGFFIGDGAGVGKGRQIAGIILDSWARGRRKHVWFSISTDLKLDAQRDLKDIGCHISVIDGCQGLDSASSKGLGISKSAKHGCLFSTYSTLTSSRSSATGKKPRLEQLVDWCGGSNFDGCLVFDEAHKAKNFNSVKEELSTKISQAVIKIQEMLPKARVVYCSATGVTDLGNLAYATRLGLWGPHCPFSSFKSFKFSMEKRGLGALEMLAMELKANGSYVSRGLSWKGAEFDTREVELPPKTVLIYDQSVDFWMLLRRELEKAAQMCGNSGICKADKCAKGHVCSPMRQFWGQQQRFFREMTSAAKVEFVVIQAKEALSSGMSVVVGLHSTGESGLDKAMEEMGKRPGDTVDRIISPAYSGIVGFIKLFFPTRTVVKDVHVLSDQEIEDNIRQQIEAHIQAGYTQFDVERARAGLLRIQAISKLQAAEQAVSKDLPECIEAKNKLLALAKKLDLLPSPLDALIDALGGPEEVAEMTGRRARLVRCTRSGRLKYELRPENEETSLNIRERELFMSAKKRVAIISDAASTGVSLHAAVGTVSAVHRRLHITLELPWSADKAIQQLGRSHRSNQASAPVFRLLVTNLGGERRFASAVAKRLASLGALTRGDRRAATGADFSSFDLDTKYGRRALRLMLTAIASKTGLAPGVDVSRLAPYIQPRQTCLSRTTVAETAVAVEVTGSGASRGQVEGFTSEAKNELLAVLTQAAEESLEEMGIESNQYNNVALFLGRIQGLPVRRQNLMFAYLIGALEAVVAEARAAGLYDEGVADIRASSVTLKGPPEEVARDSATGAVTTLAQLVLDRGVRWEQALAKRREASEAGMDEADENLKSGTSTPGMTPKPKGTGFYRSRHTDITTQKKLVLLAVRKAKHNRLMVITRPNTGTSPYELDLVELREKYYRVPDDEEDIAQVKQAWIQAFDLSNGADYKGSRKVALGLLSGSVLPVWSALEKTIVACRADMTRAEQALKVYRVILDDGRKLVGVRVPITVLSILRQHLGETMIARKIMTNGGYGGTVEPVVALDPQALLRAKTPPKNMYSYFSPVARTSSSLPVVGVKRAAIHPRPASSGRGGNKRDKSVGAGNGDKKKEKQGSMTKNIVNLFGAQRTSVTHRGGNSYAKKWSTTQAADVIVIDD